MFEVDLEPSEEELTTGKLNDYPPAPEKIKINQEWLSNYQKKLIEGTPTTNVEKLVPHMMKREKYVVHEQTLYRYIQLGFKVTKVRRISSYTQVAWMKSYIEGNIARRARAKNKIEKDFYKLMCNSVFGKTMENIRNRRDIRIVETKTEKGQKRASKLFNKSNFANLKIFNENLCGIEMYKRKLYMNKPIYVGMSILDLSKEYMYWFYYDVYKKMYPNPLGKPKSCQLLYTDTDSFIMNVYTEDVYYDMLPSSLEKHNIPNIYDTSDYPQEHFLYSSENKKVLGKMKDEMNGRPIEEYVGIRSKMYSVLVGNHSFKKAKGIKKCVIQRDLTHEMFKSCIFDSKQFTNKQKQITSQNHNLYTTEADKVSLNPFDNKRYICDDKISTLPFMESHEGNNT